MRNWPTHAAPRKHSEGIVRRKNFAAGPAYD